jgi:glycosyltransferase involved in cell wall biosynthesis
LPRTARQIRELISRHRIDLVYVNGPRLVLAAVWASGRSIPIVFHCHSFVPSPYGMLLVRWPLKWAAATMISSSKFTASSVRHQTPLHVIYNGVPDLSSALNRQQGATRGNYRIGLIGRIAPQKGQLLFVQAARLVGAALPRCSFEIYGAPLFSDTESARYDKQVRELAQGLPIQFTGWIDDVASVLARLDLLVVPSLDVEATTRVILEAFSSGVPVVALATGGIPEVISHGRTGFLVTERTPEALAQMILAAISQGPDSLESIATAARKEWETRFTLERFQSDVLDLLDRVGSSFKSPEQGPKHNGGGNRHQGDRGENHRIAKL